MYKQILHTKKKHYNKDNGQRKMCKQHFVDILVADINHHQSKMYWLW